MNLDDCAPLPGDGFLARSGNLVVLCAMADGGEDLLLSVLDKVAAAGGDGGDLVRAATRAALEHDSPPGWACAGVTSAGAVAVLVHGAAVAQVTAGAESACLTGADAVIPVSRLFTGSLVTVTLTLPGHGDPDSRLRLDGGVVHGGGVTLTAVGSQPASAAGLAAQEPVSKPPGEAAAGPEQDAGPVPGRDTTPIPEDQAPKESGPAELPTPQLAQPVLHQPDASANFESVLLILSDDDQDRAAPAQAAPAPAEAQPLVDGVYCPQPKNKPFNDPAVAYCRVCGIGMLQQTRAFQRGPRPPLGVLLLDDGMTFRLDTDYVVGRDPGMDAEVAAGRARPLRVIDAGGTVSRLHLRVSLVGWRVHVTDLGSANGSVVRQPQRPEPQRLTPHEAVEIKPGSTVNVGHRAIRFESYLGS